MRKTSVFTFIKAMWIAFKLHRGQKYADQSYFMGHIVPVVIKVYKLYGLDYELMTIAALHDVIEDTNVSTAWLEANGIPHSIAYFVGILSKLKTQKYEDYLHRVANYRQTYLVKYADILCNFTKSIADNDKRRVDKYTNAMRDLHSFRTEISTD